MVINLFHIDYSIALVLGGCCKFTCPKSTGIENPITQCKQGSAVIQGGETQFETVQTHRDCEFRAKRTRQYSKVGSITPESVKTSGTTVDKSLDDCEPIPEGIGSRLNARTLQTLVIKNNNNPLFN